MKTTAGLRNQPAVRGFTLIELLLTVVLLLLLAGALVINFSGLQSSGQLDEAGEHLESALRYARAYATSTGCRVRVSFEEEVGDDMSAPLGNMFVEWEPDPLNKPGIFEPLQEVAPLIESMLDAVQVSDVRALDAWGAAPSETAAPGEETTTMNSFAPITFFPDGSSDSAQIILAPRAEDEMRRVAVTIIGATGAIRKTSFTELTSEEREWQESFGE